MKKQKENNLKISIEISDKTGRTLINRSDFNSAIVDLINERETYNYWSRRKMEKLLNKRLRRIKNGQ